MTRAKLVQAQRRGHPARREARLAAGPDGQGLVSHGVAVERRVQEPRRAAADGEGAPASTGASMMPTYDESPSPAFAQREGSAGAGTPDASVAATNGRVILFTTCFVEYSEARTAARRASRCSSTTASRSRAATRPAAARPSCTAATSTSATTQRRAKVVAGLIARVRAGRARRRARADLLLPAEERVSRSCSAPTTPARSPRTPSTSASTCSSSPPRRSSTREFPKQLGRIAYHLPCHLKAQNIGFRSKQLLGLVCDDVR